MRVVLGGFFVNAILAAAILGVGVNPAFSDATLRRFPLSAPERCIVRHLTALLEPLWVFILALDVGVAAGCIVLETSPAWLALPSAVLLVACNYLVAQVVVTFVDRVMRTDVGRVALVVLVCLVAFLAPALRFRAGAFAPGVRSAAAAVANLTPPMIAAAALSSRMWSSADHVLALAVWCLGPTAALVWLERWRPASRTEPGAAIAWDSSHDRVAALFGPALAPLMGKMLRYYTRSPQTRLNFPLALPGLVAMVATTGYADPPMMFPMALGGIAFAAASSSGALYLNLFGFDGAGFRRYFLLPVAPSKVLLAAALVALLPGACLIPAGVLLWAVYSPVQADVRSLIMLASSGVTGLLAFGTCGVWTSLLAPTAIEFDRTWGNKLSAAANVVMVASILCFFGFVAALRALGIDNATLAGHWWVAAIPVLPAGGAFAATVLAGGRVMRAQRERMLSLIDPS